MNTAQVNQYAQDNLFPTTVTDALGNFSEAYLVCETYDGEFIYASLWEEDENFYVNDSNVSFYSEDEAHSYYSRQFRTIWAFDFEDDRDVLCEYIEENI